MTSTQQLRVELSHQLLSLCFVFIVHCVLKVVVLIEHCTEWGKKMCKEKT